MLWNVVLIVSRACELIHEDYWFSRPVVTFPLKCVIIILYSLFLIIIINVKIKLNVPTLRRIKLCTTFEFRDSQILGSFISVNIYTRLRPLPSNLTMGKQLSAARNTESLELLCEWKGVASPGWINVVNFSLC